MGLLDKLIKKNTPKPKEPLEADQKLPIMSGEIEKEGSMIMAVPFDDSLLDDISLLLDKLMSFEQIEVVYKKTMSFGDNNEGFEVCFVYNDEELIIQVKTDPWEPEDYINMNWQPLTQEERNALAAAPRVLNTRMFFGQDAMSSFHMQIKLLCAMIERPAAIVDISSLRSFSGRWARLTAASSVPPAPEYLFIIHAVNDDEGKKDEVWLHTHGLERCGSIELEILRSDQQNCQNHGTIINTMASRIITKEKLPAEYEPVWCAELEGGIPLVITWITWQRAITMYPKDLLGGMSDRDDDHGGATGVIYVYASDKDAEDHLLSNIDIYNHILAANPLLMISSEETQRMSRLAYERIDYLKRLFAQYSGRGKFAALIKVGLEVDDEFKNGSMREHCWFEVTEMNDNFFKGVLTHETFYIKDLHEGSECQCSFDDITDWTVFMDNAKITPDNVYLLEK